MNTTFKPFLQNIKNKLKHTNPDELKAQISQNLNMGRMVIEATAKDLYEQSKNSQTMSDYILPAVESKKADTFLNILNNKLHLKNTPLMNSLERLRSDLIDSKVNQAKAVEKLDPEATQTTQASAEPANDDNPVAPAVEQETTSASELNKKN